MNRIKLMLTGIGILAVVGGALAFNAKSYGINTYCTTTFGSTGNCIIPEEDARFAAPTPPLRVKYIQVTSPTSCSGGGLPCTQVGNLED